MYSLTYGSCIVNGHMSILIHGHCTPNSAKPIGLSFSTILTAFSNTYLLNPFLPPVSERDYALSANFLLWSSYHNNLSCACHIPVDHTKTFIKCLYHLAISDIYCHMADVLISSVACKTVEDKVSRL